MSTAVAGYLRPVPMPKRETLRRDPAAQAFLVLRIAFTVAPILFGLDKFAEVLTDDWTKYLATQFNDILPGSAGDAMYLVGAVEVVAGLVVLVAPRSVACWSRDGSPASSSTCCSSVATATSPSAISACSSAPSPCRVSQAPATPSGARRSSSFRLLASGTG